MRTDRLSRCTTGADRLSKHVLSCSVLGLSLLLVSACGGGGGGAAPSRVDASRVPTRPPTPRDAQPIAAPEANPFNAESPLGTNVAALNYWTTEWVVVDGMKISSPGWFTQCNAMLPGCDPVQSANTGEQDELDLDEHGWVRSLPDAGDASVMYRSVGKLMWNGNAGDYPAGLWVVLYEGEGTLRYRFDATKDEELSRPGRDVLRVEPSNEGILLEILATDPRAVGNHLRNIRVLSPGGRCISDPFLWARGGDDCPLGQADYLSFERSHEQYPFHPRFLADLKAFKALRFMDFQKIIGATQSEWDERPKPSDASWTGPEGAPVEVAVQLANTLHADPWINVPTRASDDWVRQAAAMVGAELDSRRVVYLEYSNETWNNVGAFQRNGQFVHDRGAEEWPEADPFIARFNWYAKRTVEVCSIWREVLPEGRVVCVLGSMAASSWLSDHLLACPLAAPDLGVPCGDLVDAVAIAPYFGGYLGSEIHHGEVSQWTAREDGGLSMLLWELTGVAPNGEALAAPLHDPALEPEWARTPAQGALALAAAQMREHALVAERYEVELLGYEGGQHLAAFGPVFDDMDVQALFLAANQDPAMGILYRAYLNDWRDSGGHLLFHWKSVERSGLFGSWGAKEFQTQDDAPKYRALVDFIDENPCWWDGCVSN